MDKDTEEIVKRVATGGLISLMAATIRFLLKTGEPIWTKVKTLIAGVFLGLLVSMILIHSSIPIFWQNVLCSTAAAFVSTIWPVIETGVVNLIKVFFKKKQREIDDDVDSFNRGKYPGGGGRNNSPSEYP